tara:strand:- start:160 stop:600 length:441 start_codon:yes stop_codon:yes gene_type:complete
MSELLKLIPKKIKISYADVKISVTDDKEFTDTCYGEYSADHNIIKLSKESSDFDLANTILHELIHCAVWYGGLKDDGAALADDDKEENVVNVISNNLCQIFKDNPKILTIIKKGLSKKNGRSKERNKTVEPIKKIFDKYTFHKNRK